MTNWVKRADPSQLNNWWDTAPLFVWHFSESVPFALTSITSAVFREEAPLSPPLAPSRPLW